MHAHAVTHVQAAAQAGDTRPPALDEVVALHFVALAQRDGRLLELDGRKPFPIDHGESSPDTLLQVCSELQTLVDLGQAHCRHASDLSGPYRDSEFAVQKGSNPKIYGMPVSHMHNA